MKKVLSFFFAALMLLSVFAFSVSAEETSDPSVMTELAGLYIDGKQFNAADYPVDTTKEGLQVLAVSEVGYRPGGTSASEYDLFFYVYNPSCKELVDLLANRVQIGLNDQCNEYYVFGLRFHSKSADNRFYKFSVYNSTMYSPKSYCYEKQENDYLRVYNVVTFNIATKNDAGNTPLQSYKIDEAFFFQGFDYDNSLKSYIQELGALDVELHSTNWISPNAGYKVDGSPASIYDHYEINTVYFTVPKEYLYGYGNIKSLRATYDALRLTPIVVTRPGDFDATTKNAILEGKTIWKDANGNGKNDYLEGVNDPTVDVMDLFWQNEFCSLAWIYTENDYTRSAADTGSYYDREAICYNSLAYYFEALDSAFDYENGSISKAVVSSTALREYFYDRYDPDGDNSQLYSEISQGLVIDYHSRDFDNTALWNMTSYGEALKQTSKFNQWWKKLTLENDAYVWEDFKSNADHIYVIDNPSAYVSLTDTEWQEACDDLFLGVADKTEFTDLCAKAAANNEVVVLLRFGFSDYRFQVGEDVAEYALGIGKDVCVVVDKWAYMNLSLLHIVFNKDGADITVPTASNVIDSFGSLDVGGKPTIDNPSELFDDARRNLDALWAKFKKILGWVLLGVVVVLLAPFVIWLVRKVSVKAVKRKKNSKKNKRE